MVSGWLLVRRVPPSGRAAGWMGREARKYSTHQAAKLRGIVAWGSTIAGGAALLFSVERWYKVCWEGNMVPGSGVKEHVSATGPPGNAHSSSVPAALQGYTGKVATYADLMVCSSEKGDVEYISNGGASWGGGEAIDISQAEEPGTAPASEKKDTKVINLEQEMLKRRKIIIHGPIDDHLAYTVCMKIMFLEMEDPGKPIEMMINSPGGKVAAGLAIYDWMQLVSSPVHTMCWGRAYSMGAVLLAAGEKGHRVILPNAKVMIHQPSVEIPRAVATDILIKSKEMQDTKAQLKTILAKHMEMKEEWVEEVSERDYYMKADEAIQCGIVDKIATRL